MARKGRARLRKLVAVVAQTYPDVRDPRRVILARRVLVDGHVAANPASLVRPGAVVSIAREKRLRGEAKLEAALAQFDVHVAGRATLDLGAAAGGFTRVLLRAGAAKVYAVDVGFGQLLGSLRLDPRVVNLERTNVSALDRSCVPDAVEIVSVDVSYLPLAEAVAQLDGRILIAGDADLVGLVKPQFELGLARPPTAAGELAVAVEAAVAGIAGAGWTVEASFESPVRGSRGAIEFLVHATRRGGT